VPSRKQLKRRRKRLTAGDDRHMPRPNVQHEPRAPRVAARARPARGGGGLFGAREAKPPSWVRAIRFAAVLWLVLVAFTYSTAKDGVSVPLLVAETLPVAVLYAGFKYYLDRWQYRRAARAR
jgi:hypothetical protein